MELAAVVMAPDEKDFASLRPALSLELSRPFYSPLLPILGNDVRRTWTDRVHRLGAQSFWLTSVRRDERKAYSQVWRLAKQGVERILMIKLKFYVEMDLADLLRFHCQTHNSITEVHDSRGQLGVSVLDCPAVLASVKKGESFRMSTEAVAYPFNGYAKRILSSKERQELVGDALAGACALRPVGAEIREHVWLGESVSLSNSAKVLGPTYIGDHAIVRPGATIGPFASVERGCLVDCGTAVERSTVLPSTHLAPGLLIKNALIDGEYMEDLQSGALINLQQCGLARRIPRRSKDAAQPAGAATGSHPVAASQECFSEPSPMEWHNVY